jgi:uncharacterized membrane protein
MRPARPEKVRQGRDDDIPDAISCFYFISHSGIEMHCDEIVAAIRNFPKWWVIRAARNKDPRAAERVIRRSLRGPHNRGRLGSASPRASHLQIAVGALADMAHYMVSYLFIALVWTNHHHLMCYATEATPHLVWFNFAHLFSVSLLPLSTAWMAVSELAAQPVAFYAAVFFLVSATYICLIYELIDRAPVDDVLPRERSIMHLRSIAACAFSRWLRSWH